MSYLTDVVAQVASLDASFTTGSTLFAGRLPTTPDRCIAVYEYLGDEQLETFGDAGETDDKPRLQVICRAGQDEYEQASNDAHLIHVGLDQHSATWGSTTVLRCRPLSPPEGLGVDDGERPLVAVRFTLIVARA